MSAAPAIPTLSLEQAKSALREAIAAFSEPENQAKMNAAIAACGGDAAKYFLFVMPVAVQVQSPVIAKYGFQPNAAGAMQFAMAVNMHQADAEVREGVAALKAKYMPPQPAT